MPISSSRSLRENLGIKKAVGHLFNNPLTLSKAVIIFLIASGFALRIFLIAVAENKLDFDETTVGIMALNIYEGKDFPVHFYGARHNIGGAVEAYVAAAVFMFFGIFPLGVKLALVLIWLATCWLFLRLSRRLFSPFGTCLAVASFCFPPLFFIDFSMKARGGFAETIFFSVLLLYLAYKIREGKYRHANTMIFVFAVFCSLSVLVSEMGIVLAGCLLLWMGCHVLLRRLGYVRFLSLVSGAFIGILPYLIYNFETISGRSGGGFGALSYIFAFSKGNGSPFVGAGDMLFALKFVFAPSLVLIILIALSGAGTAFLSDSRSKKELFAVLVLYSALSCVALFMHGYRYGVPIPSSRVLYVLYPVLSIFFGFAGEGIVGSGKKIKSAVLVMLVAWFGILIFNLAAWGMSRKPISHSSWYGKWSFVDGELLYSMLVSDGITDVFCGYHIASPLIFSQRIMSRHNDPFDFISVNTSWERLEYMEPESRIAFVGFPGSTQTEEVIDCLVNSGVAFRTVAIDNVIVIFDIDAGQMRGVSRLPRYLHAGVLPPPGPDPKGFN